MNENKSYNIRANVDGDPDCPCPFCGGRIFNMDTHLSCLGCPFSCAHKDLPRIAAAMKAEARHNALMEAVKKLLAASNDYSEFVEESFGYGSARLNAARAEVDRLIATADCEGKG